MHPHQLYFEGEPVDTTKLDERTIEVIKHALSHNLITPEKVAEVFGKFRVPTTPPPPAPPTRPPGPSGNFHQEYNSDRLADMILMRLRPQHMTTVMKFLAAHVAGDKVYVFMVTDKGEAVTIEDDWNMFPSDALITKIRLVW